MTLSVIIPCLNEAAALPALLADLRAQQGVTLQLIVADGGSQDGTVAMAQAAGAQVLHSARGRGVQMNAGARVATAPWLLFLHADTRLEHPRQLAESLAALRAEDDPRCAGHWGLRFARTRPGADTLYRYMEGKTRSNRPWTINGDQGLLIARAFFDELGGFDQRLSYFEDQRLAARIFAQGRWCLLPGTLTTSARRFEAEGAAERYTLMALMMALHAGGAEEFFTRAPQLYAAQSDTGALDLRPFLRLIRQIVWQRRWRGAAQLLGRIGRFVRENAWQLAYRLDLRRPRGALAFYDRHLARRLDNRLCDALTALLAIGWFYLWLPAWTSYRRHRRHC